jgi:hypothetical protein
VTRLGARGCFLTVVRGSCAILSHRSTPRLLFELHDSCSKRIRRRGRDKVRADRDREGKTERERERERNGTRLGHTHGSDNERLQIERATLLRQVLVITDKIARSEFESEDKEMIGLTSDCGQTGARSFSSTPDSQSELECHELAAIEYIARAIHLERFATCRRRHRE